MPLRVLLIGATGVFGSRIARRWPGDTRFELILAGRHRAVLDALAAALAALQQWCREAEASGNCKPIEFAARLKRYSVARA